MNNHHSISILLLLFFSQFIELYVFIYYYFFHQIKIHFIYFCRLNIATQSKVQQQLHLSVMIVYHHQFYQQINSFWIVAIKNIVDNKNEENAYDKNVVVCLILFSKISSYQLSQACWLFFQFVQKIDRLKLTYLICIHYD